MTDDARPFPHRHLLGIADLSRQDIEQILALSHTMLGIAERPIKKLPTLRGRTVLNLFLENSTRTRVSFELAAKRMGADAINIGGSGSSLDKGETILDTAQNLMAMKPDVIIIRHPASGAPHLIARHVDAAIINAGDGAHEHPTQALLDCATIKQVRGNIDGLEVAIVGDIEHSRVARSTTLALTKLGARVRLCGPRTLVPRGIELISGEPNPAISVHHNMNEAIEGVDVIMMLRVQNERLGGAPRFPNTREYSRTFGLNRRLLALAKPDAIVMHPGPVNRGVELMPDVQDGVRSVILDQVTHGVAVRMAVLYLLGGGAQGEQAA